MAGSLVASEEVEKVIAAIAGCLGNAWQAPDLRRGGCADRLRHDHPSQCPKRFKVRASELMMSRAGLQGSSGLLQQADCNVHACAARDRARSRRLVIVRAPAAWPWRTPALPHPAGRL